MPVHRKAETSSEKTSGKTSGKILVVLKQDRNLTIPELASLIGVTERSIERNMKKLQEQGRLRRIGPAKGATGRFNESYPHGLSPIVKEVRRQLALGQEDLARVQLDAFCKAKSRQGKLEITGVIR